MMNLDSRGTRPLLDIQDLRVEFVTDAGTVRAVDGVSLHVKSGQTVALVGESGCGKSVTALSLLRLIPRPPGRVCGGRVFFTKNGADRPVDLLRLSAREITAIRGGGIAMIFQDPMSSLNPVLRVGRQIVEAVELHRGLRGRPAKDTAIDLLQRVGIPAAESRYRAYPHQMSGGMLQRAMIATALACEPSLLIADEPTTALDVTVQTQILALLREVQASTSMGVLIITHDLDVVAQIADYVYVMYAGRLVEHASVAALLAKPMHPYTRGLMACVPRLAEPRTRLEVVRGNPPDPTCFPPGCRFHPRCGLSAERAEGGDRVRKESGSFQAPVLRRCVEQYDGEASGVPPLRECEDGHFTACWET